MGLYKFIILILVAFNFHISNAEYRAYELQVDNVESGQVYRITTTLDHLQ